jgi:hypothetical protein
VKLGGVLGIAGDQGLFRALAHGKGNLRHIGEASPDFLGEQLPRRCPPGDLGDMHGQRVHPLRVGGDLDGAEDLTQVAGHRLLQRQQIERGLFGLRAHRDHLLVAADHFVGGVGVSLQESPRRALHRSSGMAAHLSELRGQIGHLLVVNGSHR